jgi:DNA-binding IclR family transcriptional regulator
LSELARQLDLSKGTIHAILGSLEEKGYVAREAGGRGFTLGSGLVPLGAIAERAFPAIAAAKREAQRLADRFDAECVVSAPTDGEILIVSHAGVQRALGVTAEDGQRIPLVPPMGSVFMAWAPGEQVRGWLARIESDGPADEDRYKDELNRVRERGYAIAYAVDAIKRLNDLYNDAGAELHTRGPQRRLSEIFSALGRERYLAGAEGEPTRSIVYLAAPVFDPVGQLVCSIALLPGERYDETDVPELSAELLRSAATVMRETSGRRPDVAYLS